MTAVEPTIQPDDVDQRLRSWMADQRPDADLSASYARIVTATASQPGPRSRVLVRLRATRTRPPSIWAYRVGRLAPMALLALILSLVIVGGAVVGDRLSRDDTLPRPEASVRPVPSASFAPSRLPESSSQPDAAPTGITAVAPLEIELARRPGTPGGRYTSSRFEPKVTFGLAPWSAGPDICLPVFTSPRTIVLSHPMGCVGDVRFITPWAVACGAAGTHPDADELARAILALPGATDLGDVQSAREVPEGTFHEPYAGRVVSMSGGGPVPRGSHVDRASDPDHCVLLPEPGSGDPIIEIRHDIAALFVLLDVHGALVVLRASSSGHDSTSHAEAVERGYASLGDLDHLLGLVKDVRFGP
jgi:hypothetical protein